MDENVRGIEAIEQMPCLKEKKQRVAIIILNWNGKEHLENCITSLLEQTYRDKEILLVDNGSTDDSVAFVRQKFPSVIIVETGKNLGFAGGNNIGIRFALKRGADLVMLVNNDTKSDKSLVGELVKAAQSNPDVGIVGPRIYYFQNPKVLWFAGGKVNLSKGWSWHLGMKKEDDGSYDVETDVDYITGCCMLVKREVFKKIGYLYEPYYLYYEDTDFCLRAKRNGFRVIYTPKAIMWHKYAASSGLGEISTSYYYLIRNLMLFEKRNANRIQKFRFLLRHSRRVSLAIFRYLMRGRFDLLKRRLSIEFEGAILAFNKTQRHKSKITKTMNLSSRSVFNVRSKTG